MTVSTTGVESGAPFPPEEIVPARDAVPVSEVAGELSLRNLPGRELSKHELRALTATIAARPESWQAQLAFDDDERHFVSVHRDAHVDVWLVCWTPANDTGWHDHDISSGAVAVSRGALVEHNLAVTTAGVRTDVEAGNVFCFGPDHIHRLTGRDHGTVSIHAYSPPLWRMGQYAVSRTGVLRRLSVSYAEELRPLDDGPVSSDAR